MKKIAITMGDAGGIGPEIIVRALHDAGIRKLCIPVVIGNISALEEAIKLAGLPLKLKEIGSTEETKHIDSIGVIDISGFKKFKRNRPDPENGASSVRCIKKAVELALDNKVCGIVTAPISKEALKMAGFKWPGHTEMLAELTKTKDYAMMLAGGPLRVILVTTHTSIKSIPRLITREKILKTIRLAKMACRMLSIKNPEIAVAGLNPHAGEAGIFGDEEIKTIIPAIKDAKKQGIASTGPFPPDTIFHKAYKGEVDIVVCMYHDQGLIPLKMIAFEKGVNVTVGLPIIRTSPDHGTAYDIAWKGVANPLSMIEAIKMAVRLKI